MSEVNGVLFKYNNKVTISTTGVTTYTTSNQAFQMASVFVPANTFTVGDIVTIESQAQMDNTTSTRNWTYFRNTTDSLSGAQLLAIRAMSNTFINQYGMRRLAIRSSTTSTLISATNSSFYSDFQAVSQPPSTLVIDWTVNNFFIIAGQNGTGSQQRCIFLKISN